MSHADKKRKLTVANYICNKNFREMLHDKKVELAGLTNQQFYQHLQVAVDIRDVSIILRLLEVRPQLNPAIAGCLLWRVIKDNEMKVASMLVKAGADVNQQNFNEHLEPSFLHVIAKSDDSKKIALALLMIDHGANTSAKDANGSSVIEYAFVYKNLGFAQELLKYDVVIDHYVFYAAAYCSKPTEAMLMLVNTISLKDVETKTALLNVAFKSLCELDLDERIIIGVLDAIIDLEIPELSLMLDAISYSRMGVMKLLLKRADVDTHAKMMFLHAAVSLPTSSMARVLVEWGASIDYSIDSTVNGFEQGMCPLHVACQYGSQENIELLLQLGADINATDSYGATPLSFLRNDQLSEACRLVIQHLTLSISKGATVNECDLALIASQPIFQEFYDECSKELQKTRKFRFFNGIEFHSIFTKSIEQLSLLTRRQKLVDEYNQYIGSFSIFRNDLNRRFQEARQRNELLTPKVCALYEALGGILHEVPMENIVKHLYLSYVKTD